MKLNLRSAIVFLCVLFTTKIGLAQCSVTAFPAIQMNHGCEGDSLLITNLSTGVDLLQHTYYWDLNNDGMVDDSTTTGSLFFLPSTAGWQVVTLTIRDTAGCSSAVTDSAFVSVKSSPQFSVLSACEGALMMVTDASTGFDLFNHKFYWDVTEDGLADDSTQGSFSFLPSLNDTFDISLTITDTIGCSATTTQSAMVWRLPVVHYSTTPVCQGSLTVFTDQSSEIGNNPTYEWDLTGDGITDTLVATSFGYIFSNAGIHSTSLRITTENGCSARDSQMAIVDAIPVAKFGATVQSTCITTPVMFIDSSLNTNSTTSYFWDYNNDGIAENTHTGNTSYNYGSMGTGAYTIKLKVMSVAGCADSTYRSVTITSSPISVNAGTDKTIVCSGNTTLTAVSNRTTGVTYAWTPMFNINNPSVASTTASPDTTTLYIVSATYSGCSAFDTVKVEVTPIVLSAGIDQAVVCGNSVSLSATSNISSGLMYSWTPTIGLNNYAASTTLATPLNTTNYVLTATKGTCKAIDSVTILVNPIQVSIGSDKSIACGSTVTLTTSVNTTGVSYEWWPARDLSSFTVVSPVASPTDTTTYIVKVSKNGCESRDTVSVNVYPYVVFAGSDKTITCGTTTTFSTNVSGVSGPQYSWAPSFGLSNPFISNPTATVTVDTTYVVTVTKGLCVSRDTISVFVNHQLPIAFTANKTLTNQRPFAIKFTNQTTNAGNYNFTWLFEDGGTSNQLSPSYTFANPGQYGVSLVAQSLNGACVDTLNLPGYITCMAPTGLEDVLNGKAKVLLYPNPTEGSFTVKLNAQMSGGTLSVFNVTGQQILSKHFGTTIDEELLVVDEIKAAGMYMLVISSEAGIWNGKFIVN